MGLEHMGQGHMVLYHKSRPKLPKSRIILSEEANIGLLLFKILYVLETWALMKVSPSYEFCFEQDLYILDIITVTTLATTWVHLMRYYCNYDLKHKLGCTTNI